MNAILSMILSLVLAFGGGAMPAVPETAITYTVSDIVLSVDDETVALNPELVLTTAAGSEKLQAQFGIALDGDTLVPLAGEINPEGVKFNLGGRSYALSADTLNQLTGMSEPDAQAIAPLQEFGELMAMLPELYSESLTNMEENFVLSEEMMAYWTEISGATAEQFEMEVKGVTLPVTCVELNLTLEQMVSGIDQMQGKGSEAMQAYLQGMVDLMGKAYGMEFAGYADMYAKLYENVLVNGEDAMSFAIPMEMTYGAKDGLYYMEAIVNTEQDGLTMDISAATVYQDGVTEMTMNMTAGDAEISIGMAGAAAYDLTGNLDLDFELAAEMMDESVLSCDFSFDRSADEDGLADVNANLAFEIAEMRSYYDSETGETETEAKTTDVSIGWTAEESLEDNGSLTTNCELTFDGDDGIEAHGASLTFALNRAEAPFADAFAGAEIVELTADTESEAYQLLSSELFGPLADLMTLSMEESVAELTALFEVVGASFVTTEEADYYDMDEEYYINEYGIDEPDDYEYPEYVYDAASGEEPDLAAAAEIYGSELPSFTLPEGYELNWMYVSEEYCNMDFYSGEEYLSVLISPVYSYNADTMQLGADGSLTSIDGSVVTVEYNEDGTIYYLSFTYDDVSYSIYVNEMTLEEVQAVLAGFVG